MAENSTNVRLASAVLRGLGAVSPRAAASVVFQLFRLTRPRRDPRFTPAPDAVEHFVAGRHRVASYVWAGGGPTVVLVHGWNGTSGDLSAFIAPLRDTGRRVVAIDLPAHGRSSGRFSDLTEAVDAVEAVLRREPGIEAVIAHSFGVPAIVLSAARAFRCPGRCSFRSHRGRAVPPAVRSGPGALGGDACGDAAATPGAAGEGAPVGGVDRRRAEARHAGTDRPRPE